VLYFLSIVFGLWGLLHLYTAVRLVAPLRIGRAFRRTLYALWALVTPLSPAVFFADRFLGEPYALIYRWVAWTYMGAFSTLFAMIVARDAGLLLRSALRILRSKRGEHSPDLEEPERRRFLVNATNGGIIGLTGGLTVFGITRARRVPTVVEVEVPIKNLPTAFEGYHIVQISDVHVGETIDKDFILPIVEAVTSLGPDLVAVTGDIVDGSVDKLRADISPLAYLRARDGVYCVTGNHEYYSGADEWCQHFEELGMSVLNNRHVIIERAGKKLALAGVTDAREGKNHPGHRSDPRKAILGAPAHDLSILLAHQPKSAFEAAKHGYALQLSGHTHGGQFFPWNLFVGLVQRPVARGLGKYENLWVYVNQGTCYWGPPIRSFPAEITSLRLKRA